MKNIVFVFFFISSIVADEKIFNELLEKVKQGYKIQTIEDKQREKRFLKEVVQQQNIVNQLKKDIKKEKRLADKLKKDINFNELGIQKLSNDLEMATGDLGELFGTVKQISSDMNVHIKNSLISSKYPDRVDFLNDLSTQTELPDIKELEKLWYIIFQEIVESGKVVRYTADVISDEAIKKSEEIIRIGNFNSIVEDGFLQYESSNKLFVKPSYQPDYSYLSTVSDFVDSSENITEVVIDPTRGTILDMLSQKPTIQQRVDQGGAIGYIIIFLAILGVVFALGKYIWLYLIDLKVKKQLKDTSKANLDNPLGRVIHAYETNYQLPFNDLEYKVDEAFYKEIPTLQSGFSMVKLFAATTPLLGLLGTVTGMILTFQSITLFGTNDPKLMAGGISQALITTMLGLIAAIPLLFAHTILSSKAKKIINILEQNATALIAKKMG